MRSITLIVLPPSSFPTPSALETNAKRRSGVTANPDRAIATGRNRRHDRVQRPIVHRVECLAKVEHGHRTVVAMLKRFRRGRRGAARMIDDVCEGARRRNHHIYGLPTGRRIGGPGVSRVDVWDNTQAVDHRVRSAVIRGVDRLRKVDDYYSVIPPPAHNHIRPSRARRLRSRRREKRTRLAASRSDRSPHGTDLLESTEV